VPDVDLPPALILDGISNFCILFFKDTKHDPEAPPHFWVIFPVNPITRFSMTIITSQIENRKKYYQENSKALKCLVKITNDIFDFLDRERESVIDCNKTELLSKEELIKRIDPAGPCEIKTTGKFPPFLKREIFSAIDQSPLISPSIRKIIKSIHKDHAT
jgi:hypothetical protein